MSNAGEFAAERITRSAHSVLANATDEARDDLRRESFEGGHAVAAFADDFGDLLVGDLGLPFGAGEIGSAHHGALGTIAASLCAVATGAVLHPREFHEALVGLRLAGRTIGSCCDLTLLSCGLVVIGGLPIANFAGRATASSDRQSAGEGNRGAEKAASSLGHHGDEMMEVGTVGERFSGANDHGEQTFLEKLATPRRISTKNIEPAVHLEEQPQARCVYAWEQGV